MNTLAAKQPEMVDCNHLTVHTVHTATNSATTTSNTSSNKMKPFRKMINSSKLFSTEDDIVINWDDLAAVDTTTTTTKRQHEQQQQQQQQEQQHYCTNKDQRDDVEDVYRPNKNSHSAGKSYSSLSTTCLPHNNDHRLHHQDEQRYRQEYQLRIKAETEVTNLSLELKDMEQRLIAVEKQNIQERQYMLEQLEETKQAEKDVVRNLSSTTERMSATELKLKLTEQKLIRALQDANNDKIVYANRIKEMSERLSELQSAKEQLTQALRDSECTARDINDSAEQQVNALSKELYSTKMKLQSVQEKLAIAVEKRDGEAMEKNALQEQVADMLDQARREDFTTPAGKVDDTFYEELSRGLAEIQVDARKKACDRVPYLFESTGVQVKACSLHTSIPIGEGLNLCTVDGNLPTEFAHDITAVANCDRKPNSVYAISVQSDDLEKGLGRNAVPKDVFESCAFSDNAHPADEFAILLSDETQTTKLNNKTYSADNLTTAEYTYVDTVNTDGQAKEFDKGTLVESDNIATSSFSQMLAESPMGQVVNSFASCLLPDCHSVIDKSLDFQEVCVIEDRTHHQSTSVESVVVMAAVNEENQTTPVDHGQKGATHSYDTRNRDSKAGFRQKLEDALAVSQVADSFKMCLVPDCHLIVADIEPDIPVFCQKDIYKVSPGEAQKIREATTKNATVPLDTDQEQASFSNNYLKSDFPGDKGLKIKKAAKEAEDPNIPAHVVILADCISEIGIQGVASMREEPGKRESDTNN